MEEEEETSTTEAGFGENTETRKERAAFSILASNGAVEWSVLLCLSGINAKRERERERANDALAEKQKRDREEEYKR